MADATPGRRLSVRVRLTALTVLIVGVTLTGGAWLLVSTVRDRIESDLRASGEEQLERAVDRIADGADPESVVSELPEDHVTIEVVPARQVTDDLDGVRARREDTTETNRLETAPGTYEVMTQVETDDGWVNLSALVTMDSVDRSVRALRAVLWVAIPLAIAAVGGLAWLLTGRALRPVERMRREVDEISHTSLHRRVPSAGGHDEVGRLAGTMNEMLDRLEHASDRQRQFVSDASHELRSPLATIRSAVEVAARRDDRERWERTARTVSNEVDRLDALVGNLLSLSQADEGADCDRIDLDDVDLDEIVLAEAERLQSLGHHVDTSGVGAARVQGGRGDLHRVVRNLVDNAVRHANDTVTLTLRTEGGEAVMRVDDDGDGILAADRERIFERFTRLDEGRSRDLGGAGLGLALVRAVAHAHGGSAHATDAPAGGARLEIRLPLARS